MVVDLGAAENVMPRSMFPEIGIRQTERSKNGAGFKGPGGENIKNYGQQVMSVRTPCTHSPVARTFFCAQRTHCVLRTSSCVSHTRMAQVHEKSVCRMSVFVLCISLSPFLCLTRLCCFCTVTSRPLPTATSLTIPSTGSCRTYLS